MKKYYSLSLREAIQYLNDKKEIFEDNDDTLKVSIVMPTHRTTPDYKDDALRLKVLISDATKKLSAISSKKEVKDIVENLKLVESKIDYSRNLDSLVMYVNKDAAYVVTLPVNLKPQFLVDTLFDIRPLYKTVQQLSRYYILTVSQQKIRLIEAINDKPLLEYQDENFPFENVDYYTDEPKKLAQDIFTDNLVKEFFNVADKRLKPYFAVNPIPIIIAGDTKTTAYFRSMMDDDSMVIHTLHGNYDKASLHEIVKAAYPFIRQYIADKQENYLSAIRNAEDQHKLSVDFADIYKNASQGNVNTLYIENDFSMTESMIDGESSDIPEDSELSLQLINKVRNSEGKIIFVEDNLLNQFGGLVMIRRY